jgi:hypothetical protein
MGWGAHGNSVFRNLHGVKACGAGFPLHDSNVRETGDDIGVVLVHREDAIECELDFLSVSREHHLRLHRTG